MNCIKVWNQQNIRIKPTNRYVCITDMAVAAGKRAHDWQCLKGTAELKAALATITTITVELLVVVETEEDGSKATWAHPKLAIQFAQWCNPLFAIQVSDWIEELLTVGSVSIKPVGAKDLEHAKYLCHFVGDALEIAFAGTNIKREVIGTLKLNAIEQIEPEAKPYLAEARQLLINNTATKHKLVTVTEIGKALGMSARLVNKMLIAIGYQIANPNKRSKKDCSYVAVGQGVELSDLTLATGQGKDTTTYQQLRWYDSVVESIQAAIAS